MATKVIPASPNWYCSQVVDSSPSKSLVYGARNCVYIFGCEEFPPKYLGIYCGHREKVTALCLCKHEDYVMNCCSASEEGSVKLWNTEDRTTISEHSIHQVGEEDQFVSYSHRWLL